MGYYTDYTLETRGETATEAFDCIQEISGYGWAGDELHQVKWYDWRDDLKNASNNYPEVLFILEGVGEEYPDIWTAYAKGGEIDVVPATISFDVPEWAMRLMCQSV